MWSGGILCKHQLKPVLVQLLLCISKKGKHTKKAHGILPQVKETMGSLAENGELYTFIKRLECV